MKKVSSLLHYLSNHQEKERKYEKWVTCVNWTKRITCHEEIERTDTDFEFSFCFNVLVRWFRLHRSEVRIRPILGADLKGGVISSTFFIFLANAQRTSLYLRVRLLTHFHVSLFNGISTFSGYLMPNPSF